MSAFTLEATNSYMLQAMAVELESTVLTVLILLDDFLVLNKLSDNSNKLKKKKSPKLRLKDLIKILILITIILFVSSKIYQENIFFGFFSRVFTGTADYLSILPRKIGAGIDYIASLPKTKEENKRLLQDLKKYMAKQHQLNYLEKENEKLRSLLNIKKTSSAKLRLVTSEIVNRPLDQWDQIIIINKGTKDGITKDSPVLCEDGIIGRVSETTEHYSQVQLITDPNLKISAEISRTKSNGIIQGKLGAPLEMKYISRDDEVKIGDEIISSSLSFTYPKGLPIGTVSSVQKSDFALFQDITVKPSVDFSKIRFVFVHIK